MTSSRKRFEKGDFLSSVRGGSQQVTTTTSYNGKLMSSNWDDALTSFSSSGRVNTIRPWNLQYFWRFSHLRELDNYGKINGNCLTNVFIIHEPVFLRRESALWEKIRSLTGMSHLVHPPLSQQHRGVFPCCKTSNNMVLRQNCAKM